MRPRCTEQWPKKNLKPDFWSTLFFLNMNIAETLKMTILSNY